jgi:hypothetical protein
MNWSVMKNRRRGIERFGELFPASSCTQSNMTKTRANEYGSVYGSSGEGLVERAKKAPISAIFKQRINPSLPTPSAPEKYPVHTTGECDFFNACMNYFWKCVNSAVCGADFTSPLSISRCSTSSSSASSIALLGT